MNPEMKPVDSSMILSVGYVKESQELYIKFENEGVYKYLSVPEHEYTALINASSVGKQFHSNIKDKYTFE